MYVSGRWREQGQEKLPRRLQRCSHGKGGISNVHYTRFSSIILH